MSSILNTSDRDAIYQFSHIKHDMYNYIPNTYKIGYNTKELTQLQSYNKKYSPTKYSRQANLLPSRKEIISCLKKGYDVIQFSKQIIQRSYYYNYRHRYSDNSKNIRFIYDNEYTDTDKVKLTLKFQISGYLRGVLDEYLENNWKVLRTAYDEIASKHKYPSLHNDIFKILSLYIVDYEPYRYLYPPLINEFKLWVNTLKILPIQSIEWKRWAMNYLLKDKLQRNGYNVTKNKNKVLYEQIKNGTYTEFDADTQHLWSEWIVNQCVESGRNKKNKKLANFYFKFYHGRIFPKDFKIIFDFYQDNTKMLKILARYPFFCDDIVEWVDRFKCHNFTTDSNENKQDEVQLKEYTKWKFLIDSVIKNYHSYSTKQLYKKSIVIFLKQMFTELIIATQNENEESDNKNDENENELWWKNMEYLMSKIVHGSNNSNNKYFYLSNHFDQILKYNNIKVFKWCINCKNNFMDPLILIKRPEYFDRCLELILSMNINVANQRLDLFNQFIKWNFQSILHHKNKRIVNKWIDGMANNNVITVYSKWVKAILEPAIYESVIHTEYAQVLQQYVVIAQLRSHDLQIH